MDFKKECRKPSCETDIAVSMKFDNEAVILSPDRTTKNDYVFKSNEVHTFTAVYDM